MSGPGKKGMSSVIARAVYAEIYTALSIQTRWSVPVFPVLSLLLLHSSSLF